MGDHELNTSMYQYLHLKLHHNTPLITAVFTAMYSTACTESIVQILFWNACILDCGTAFPPLPNHGICIYYVEYTYLQTDKIFWLGKGGNILK